MKLAVGFATNRGRSGPVPSRTLQATGAAQRINGTAIDVDGASSGDHSDTHPDAADLEVRHRYRTFHTRSGDDA
jgi:hypothetical protein